MYSYEIEKYLQEHNYQLNSEECMKIMNPNENPQIQEIKCFSADSRYMITTSDGYHFSFTVR